MGLLIFLFGELVSDSAVLLSVAAFRYPSGSRAQVIDTLKDKKPGGILSAKAAGAAMKVRARMGFLSRLKTPGRCTASLLQERAVRATNAGLNSWILISSFGAVA
jgi:hypothetical protein